ncbi:MAG TPA: EAL domain-containing protein [Solirubrobacteraceae bacterium]|nr:EAL domain-containing protein [Solirubrobacteraceae bacterium]
MADREITQPDPERAPGEPDASLVQPAESGEAASAAPDETVAEGTSAPAPPEAAAQGRTAPRARWAVAALVCVAAGSLAAALGARSIAHTNASKAERTFQTSAAGVASNLKLTLQHEEDLANSASTFFAANPGASQSDFASWSHWVSALRRYPELERIGLITVVRASDLASFQARVTGKAPATAPASKTIGGRVPVKTKGAAATTVALLRISPPGVRPYYCLATAEVVRGPARRARAGLDYCARMPALIASRAAGAALYGPVSATRAGQLAVETPVYRGAAPPSTRGGREAAFAGWLREVLVPGKMLEAAVGGQPVGAVQLSYHHGASHVSFALGTPHAGAPTRTTRVHGGWTVQSFGAPISTGVFSDPEARGLLIGGTLLSVLLGILIYVLGASGQGPRTARPVPRRARGDGLYDELTGLAGSALTLDRAERTVARAGRQSGMLAGALLIDLDWFADINEKLGSAAGDQLLRIVAERLESVIRTDDSLGRLGGDQFLITVESVARGVRLDSLARRVIEALHKPVGGLDDFGPSFYPTASIGVAYGRYTDHAKLIHDAELAMRASKEAGKDRYTLFNANMRAVIEDRGVLEAELNAALREGQLFLVYQPICDLRTRKVVGLEAHIRWRHPKQGILLPADFLPLAEETGLIVPIGRWALQEACARAAAWEVAGHHVGVGVQVSANQFNRDGFATDVLRALQQSGVSPSLLTLEIAESIVMADAQTATEHMQRLKGLGVRIAIDDFGSGYAYRSDLQRMPLDFLKVDHSSLAASEDENYRHWLLEAILVFGRDLSLTVIAKGIETGEQVGALQEMGATLAQGHYFGEPLPAEALERLLDGGVPSVRAASTGTLD